MTNRPPPTLPKWIFIVADLFLLLACAWTIHQVLPAKSSFDLLVAAAAIIAWMFGAWIAIKPWLEEFRAQNRQLENDTLASAVEQVQRIEEVAGRIQSATAAWQSAQDSATRTAAAAREIEEKIRGTTKDFIDFQDRVNSDEKRHMTLEIEKLRRVEADWLQVAARMLDHTYMLHQAALRSGQQNLINQLNAFQTAVRDTARRMGLVPFTPAVGERFDNRGHQTETPDVEPPAESIITEILATGFTFQGQLLRRALVRVGNSIQDQPSTEDLEGRAPRVPEETNPPHEEESAARTKQETEESIAADDSTTDSNQNRREEILASSSAETPQANSAQIPPDAPEHIETSASTELEGRAPRVPNPTEPEPAHPTEPSTHEEESPARTKQETEESIAADDLTAIPSSSGGNAALNSSTTESESPSQSELDQDPEPDRPRRRQRKPDPQTSLPF